MNTELMNDHALLSFVFFPYRFLTLSRIVWVISQALVHVRDFWGASNVGSFAMPRHMKSSVLMHNITFCESATFVVKINKNKKNEIPGLQWWPGLHAMFSWALPWAIVLFPDTLRPYSVTSFTISIGSAFCQFHEPHKLKNKTHAMQLLVQLPLGLCFCRYWDHTQRHMQHVGARLKTSRCVLRSTESLLHFDLPWFACANTVEWNKRQEQQCHHDISAAVCFCIALRRFSLLPGSHFCSVTCRINHVLGSFSAHSYPRV